MRDEIDTDTLIDCARAILKAQYRTRLQELHGRLDSFEAVNWEGIKARLRNYPSLLILPPEVQSLEEVEEIRLQAILGWIEEILSP